MNSSRPTVWFNEAAGATAHTIERLRRNRDHVTVRVVCSHRDPAAVLLRAADIVEIEPDADPQQYADWALEVVDRYAVDVLIPLRNLAALVARAADFAAAGATLLVATVRDFEKLDDKARCYAVCNELGIPVPDSLLADDARSYRAAYDELRDRGYEICHKPVRDVGGAGFRRITEAATTVDDLYRLPGPAVSLEDVLRSLAKQRSVPPLLVCEWIAGDQLSVDCLAWDGKVLGAVARARRSDEVREIVHRPLLLEYIGRLVEALGLAGLFNVQFRGDEEPRLIEVNPRPSGGLYQTRAVEYLWEACRLQLGRPPRPVGGERTHCLAVIPSAVPFDQLHPPAA